MGKLIAGAAVLLLATYASAAPLTIDNPKHVNLPEYQAQVLLRMSYQAVAREMGAKDKSRREPDLRLVLGEKIEGFGLDEKTGTPTIFLQEWSAEKFVFAVVRLASAGIDPHRQQQIVREVLSRSEQILPVPSARLHQSAGIVERQFPEPDCLSFITDASVRVGRCEDVFPNNGRPSKTQ